MAFSILGAINFLSPKDRGSAKIARDLVYGPAARHRLDIYAPKGAREKLPVVMFVYGGSWSDGAKDHYDFVGRAIAALGFVTVIADYRLLPEVEYPDFLRDCSDAFAHVVDMIGHFGGDAERMALVGHSAGAYNALMLALDPQYLASRNLMARVKAVAGLSGPYDFFPFDGKITLRTFGAVEEPERTQPINLVSGQVPPLWLASGDRDNLVYPRNTVALAKVLRSAGGEVTERHYANLGHPGTLMALGVLMRRRAPVLAELGDFLEQHLGAQLGKRAPLSADDQRAD
ncbi:alpha/beta hydrolase [Devosia rhodophyticola]|uniref:Alpha/beta hydrolase n=1 Tax=Devosia rhodophyticola TaxID=3026423 RepID=A0ABY7YSY3_9HYPH|nr:alpha/beta hydrolase [Devosia rhodophyticola]WDR04488.1 alpha/beta hydrolase [Devosia rhodophyticola]